MDGLMRKHNASFQSPFVSVEWLKENLGADNLKIIDASWRLPGQGDAREDYNRQHIPGAVFFPIDDVADKSLPLPHMLPTKSIFEKEASALGISSRDCIIIYDDQGLFSAARVWWTFRAMGHENVAILDGGLPRWLKLGGEVTNKLSQLDSVNYKSSPRKHFVVHADDVRLALSDQEKIVLDARPKGRFDGRDPEPRPGMRKGCMPGARNIPVTALIGADGRMKPPETLASIFAASGVEKHHGVIVTCGSGVTAAVLSLALEVLGHTRHALYDGSWAEWGHDVNDPQKFPVEEAGA